jgi:hypothetical protein
MGVRPGLRWHIFDIFDIFISFHIFLVCVYILHIFWHICHSCHTEKGCSYGKGAVHTAKRVHIFCILCMLYNIFDVFNSMLHILHISLHFSHIMHIVKHAPTQNRRRLPAFVDEFNKSYVLLVTDVKSVLFTVGYSTLRCEHLVLLWASGVTWGR